MVLIAQGIDMFFLSIIGSVNRSRVAGVFFSMSLLFGPGASSAHAQVSTRAQVPLPLEQEKARSLVREIYAPDYAAEGAKKRRALADKLLAQAAKEQNKTTRFVLLSEAVTASSEGGDLSTAFSTVDRIHSSWTVNAFDLKKSALKVFTPGKKPGLLEKESIAGAHLELIDSAIEEDRYKEAVAVSEDAQGIADKLGDRAFKADLKDRKARAQMLGKAFDALRSQYLRLLDDPDDKEANFAVGDFYCEKKRDPAAGVPFLARAPTHFLSAVSRADVGASSGGGSPFDAAEGWADLFLEGKKKRADYRDRALYWYQKALAKSAGLERTRILQRVREIRGDLRELLRPLKTSEFSALVWKDALSGWTPVGLSALNPVRKGGSLVLRNPSNRMFSYLVCDPDIRADFTARFTVKGAVAVGLLRGSGRSIRGKEVPLRGGTATVLIERTGGNLSFKVGNKKMAARRLGYSWSSDRYPQHVFFRIPRKKICYLSSVQFYAEPAPPAAPNSNRRGRAGNQ